VSRSVQKFLSLVFGAYPLLSYYPVTENKFNKIKQIWTRKAINKENFPRERTLELITKIDYSEVARGS